MVVYDLVCKQNHRFEGWFPSFEGYQEQAAKGQISCPACGTTEIDKLPHACAVIGNRGEKAKTPQAEAKRAPVRLTETEAKELLIRLHHYVRSNFEDVGPRFAEESRQIFHGKAESRPIHGTSTQEEREELDEEGIPYAVLPRPKLDG